MGCWADVRRVIIVIVAVIRAPHKPSLGIPCPAPSSLRCVSWLRPRPSTELNTVFPSAASEAETSWIWYSPSHLLSRH